MTGAAEQRSLAGALSRVFRLGDPAVHRGSAGAERQLLLDAVLLGAAGAAAAIIFNHLVHWTSAFALGGIAGYLPPGLPSEGGVMHETIGERWLWLVPLVMAAGGLLVGLIARQTGVHDHGTDPVIRSFHRADGHLRKRVAPVSLLMSTITLGTGGSAGREGPIALATAGVGSLYAGVTGRRGSHRRLLLLIAMAAGISASFRSPIGAALFAMEILYVDMEFESSALIYTSVAAIVAYALSGFVTGWSPLFHVPPIERLESPLEYGWYAVLGVVAGIVATALPMVYFAIRDLFVALRVPEWTKPAIGGALAGLVALAFPAVIGGGYGWMQQAIDGRIALGTLAALVIAKMVATSFTIGSGGSGGVFAPAVFIGAMLGGSIAGVGGLPMAPFVVVGMAAVFAGAAHVPIATMMMVIEMTGGYQLLVPATLAVVLSYVIQRALSRRLAYRSVYQSQVSARADSPAYHAQHLDIALQILRRRELTNMHGLGELDLISLLRSGIPIEVSEDKRLLIGVLRQESPYAGTTISASGRHLGGEGSNIIAILRGEHMVAPRPDLVLEKGDKLILVAAEAELAEVRKHLAPW